MSENMREGERGGRQTDSQRGRKWLADWPDGRAARFKSERPDRKRRVMIRVLSPDFTRLVNDSDSGFEFAAQKAHSIQGRSPTCKLRLGVARCCCCCHGRGRRRDEGVAAMCTFLQDGLPPTRPITWANWREMVGRRMDGLARREEKILAL